MFCLQYCAYIDVNVIRCSSIASLGSQGYSLWLIPSSTYLHVRELCYPPKSLASCPSLSNFVSLFLTLPNQCLPKRVAKASLSKWLQQVHVWVPVCSESWLKPMPLSRPRGWLIINPQHPYAPMLLHIHKIDQQVALPVMALLRGVSIYSMPFILLQNKRPPSIP